MPAGRPTKYKPEFCQDLIDHLKEGLSIECFGATLHAAYGVHVCKDTVYEWCKVYPEFSDAKKVGESYSQMFWEHLGIKGAKGDYIGFSGSAWIFNMKNRFKWRDQKEIEHSGAIASQSNVRLEKVLKNPKFAAIAEELAMELIKPDNEGNG